MVHTFYSFPVQVVRNKHFGNTLVKIVFDWQIKFNEEVANKQTKPQDKIETN